MASHRRFALNLLSSFALAVPPVALAAPPPGRLLAAQCAQCHGTDGRSVSGIDSLAGKNARELYSEMQEMKRNSGDAGNIMHPVAMAYTDRQLQLIAQYFANVK